MKIFKLVGCQGQKIPASNILTQTLREKLLKNPINLNHIVLYPSKFIKQKNCKGG